MTLWRMRQTGGNALLSSTAVRLGQEVWPHSLGRRNGLEWLHTIFLRHEIRGTLDRESSQGVGSLDYEVWWLEVPAGRDGDASPCPGHHITTM